MTRQSQKDEERNVLDWYLSQIGSGAEVISAGEPPDFTLRDGDRTVGVELTAYTQQVLQGRYSMRQTEAAWQALLEFVRQTRGQYKSLTGVSVWIEFKCGIMPGRKDYPAIVAGIAAMVEDNPPDRTFRYYSPHEAALTRFISKVRLRSVGVYMDWSWSGAAGAIGADDHEISSIVKSNNQKLLISSYDEIWLIVYGGNTISQLLDFYREDMSEFVSTVAAMRVGPFDRLILIGSDIRSWEQGQGWKLVAAK